MKKKKKIIGLILFLYYDESLVSSNLNSKQLRFYCAHPNVYSVYYTLYIRHTVRSVNDVIEGSHQAAPMWRPWGTLVDD